jgi:predicted transcriptional regulator
MATSRGHRLDLLQSRRVAGGLSIQELAKRTNLTDELIQRLERGDSCDPHVTERLLDALGPSVAITSTSIANPSNVLSAAHSFVTGDTVTIAGHTGSTPAVDGERVATVVNGTNFTIPINVTGGGTGGTARLSATSLGIARI